MVEGVQQEPILVGTFFTYCSHDRAYHYPNPIQHLARVLGDTDSRAHIQELSLSTAPSKRPRPPPKTTHPAPQGATTIPNQDRRMARPQAHPRPRRRHPLPVLKRYGLLHPYPLPSQWHSGHQDFFWADSQPMTS